MRNNLNVILKNIFPILLLIALPTTAAFQSIDTQQNNNTTDQNLLEYNFEFQKPEISTLSANQKVYTKVDLIGCINLAQSHGEPMLPVKFIQIVLPPYTQIQHIEVTGKSQEILLNKMDLKKHPIYPYQSSHPFGIPQTMNISQNKTIYQSSELYPGKTYSDTTFGFARGYPILSLSLRPIQYLPQSGKLFYCPEIFVKIYLKKTNTLNEFYRDDNNDQEWIYTLVWNKETLTEYDSINAPNTPYPGGLCDPSGSYDYVIITTTHNGLDYWTTTSTTPYNWESLMDNHLNSNNLLCNIVTIQDITACIDYHNSTPIYNDIEAHIREFCKDAYLDWNTKYILIGGDDEWIPARELDTIYEKNIDSDIYWSNLDNSFNADQDYEWGEPDDSGFDLYSELFIGRLTCDTPQDVSNWMKKSFFYSASTDIEYLDNAAFYAGNTGWNCEGDDFIDFSAIKGLKEWLGPNPYEFGPWPTWVGFLYGFETFNKKNLSIPYNLSVKWTAESPNPGWQGGTEAQAITGLRNAINTNQVTLISGIAHSNSNMSLDITVPDWETYYHNTKPFFVHDYGCHCGDIDASDDGVLHSLLFHSDIELAFGCVFNSGFGWGNLNTTNSSSSLQQKLFWHYFFDTTNISKHYGNWQLGKGHTWTKDFLAPTINWGQTYEDGDPWRSVIQGCLLFADPAQKIKPPHNSNPPETPEKPSGPTEGTIGSYYNFTSITSDPDNDQLYYLFDWGDGTDSGWLGPYDSNTIITAEHNWVEAGSYSIRVKSHDFYGLFSEWSQPAVINVGLANIEISHASGGLTKITVTIKNMGTLDAEDIHWNASVYGGITSLLRKESSGSIDYLPQGSIATINPSRPLLGLGRIYLMIKINAEQIVPVTSLFNGFIIGPFIILK